MRLAGHLASFVAGIICAAAIFAALSDSTSAPDTTTQVAGSAITPAPSPTLTPIPSTWVEGLRVPRGPELPRLLTCLDANGDNRLNAADGSWFFAGLDIPLVPEAACGGAGYGADFYESALLPSFDCNHAHAPLFFVVVAGGGSDLLDASEGDSLGLIDVTNELFDRAAEIDMPVTLTLSSGAIVGAEMPQSNLERMLADYVANRLSLVPCARAVLIGHSHGGVTVSTVTSILEDRFEGRLLGVLVDRSNVIYDRPAENFPVRVPLYNFFQTNEGWHGVPLGLPNVTDYDQSREMAPIAPADGGGGPATVTHRSLDDSPAVQERILQAILAWATRP
jgi:hypothetical protein